MSDSTDNVKPEEPKEEEPTTSAPSSEELDKAAKIAAAKKRVSFYLISTITKQIQNLCTC